MNKVSDKASFQAPLVGVDGSVAGSVQLPDSLFGFNAHPKLVAQYVRVYLANNRQGTASTKDRSQIRGTTKKMYRQKGTGNARHSTAKAPIFVGGGVAGGPKPRDFRLKINRKQKIRAFATVLGEKAQGNAVRVLSSDVENIPPKTKEFHKLAASMDAPILLVSTSHDHNIRKAARNLPSVVTVAVDCLNTYDVLRSKTVLFTHRALAQLIVRSGSAK
jgi:large subunit ribosomal protein L4